jgi:chaperone required for assembly of F1-ATPase
LAHTPGKAPLAAPTRAIAELIAAEWAGQGDVIDPGAMPTTRLANSAIDGVAKAKAPTRTEIARYAGSDLVCYRASEPEVLRSRQAQAFDPVVAWAEREFSAHFLLTQGVTHVAQPEEALQRLSDVLATYDEPFALAALHGLTSLCGSTLIALAVARGVLTAEAAWAAAHVDEDFQISKWGEDFEAGERRKARWREFEAAARVMREL